MNKGTLTFSNLGSYGWLSNQQFQITSVIGTALKNDMSFVFPTWKYSKFYKKSFPQLPKEELDVIKGQYIDREGPHHYEPIIIPDVDQNYDIGGYLQSEKYFQDHRDEVLSYFEPKDEYVDYLKEKYKHLLSKKNCAIHVRRGDYLNFPSHHPVCSPYYYKQSMSHFDEDTVYLVFSNDMDWCRQNFIGEQFHFIEETGKALGGDDVVLEQILMSMCQNVITANSTFSLWAAIIGKHFYNPDMKIICPLAWFGAALWMHKLDDMYPEGIIKI